MIWTVAKKELRGYFNSAVAVIFLAAFLAFAFLMFFWFEKAFARGLADLRPLFKWMPILLIVLVSALSMRQWADERRAGTLEVLLTLPVPRWKLVAGKFVAGLLLIATALGLTLGLPITIAQMGNLDTGPVLGGYFAALLLAGAYLSIGMCVSAVTDNQIVAFVGTALLCGASFAIEPVAAVFGLPELGRMLGTGARFESVARGVLDLRDLAYYGSIIAIGFAFNVLLLGIQTWSRGPRARPRRMGMLLAVALTVANALALNLWLAPVGRARIDLTEDRMYSLSSTTKDLIRSLDEPLLVRGYFSQKTHPLLEPLIPQIRDLLDEYRRAGGDKVRVEVVDPTGNNDLQAEAKDRYSLTSTPLQFASQTEQSVINAYFAIVVAYGDQHEVLNINDLIQARQLDVAADIEVSLRNLEYQVTRSIKNVAAAFASVDSLFATLPGQIKLTAYLTPKSLPDPLKEAPDKLKKAADELAKESGGKLVYTAVEPKIATQLTAPEAEAEAKEILRKHGVRGRRDLLSGEIMFYDLVLEIGDRIEVVQLPKEDAGDAAFRQAITDALKRGAPGFRKVVGLWAPPPPPPIMAQSMGAPQQLPPPERFHELRDALAENYEVRPVPLSEKVPDDVDALVLAGPASLDAKAVEAVDQFVMRGGSLVVLSGSHRLALDFFRRGPAVEKVTSGLEPLLEKWGVKIAPEVVLDGKNESFLVEQERSLGGGIVQIEAVQKPFAPLVRVTSEQFPPSVITGGLAGAVMAFGSPVSAEAKVGEDERRVDVLLRSSDATWLTQAPALPDYAQHPEYGVPPPGPSDPRRAQDLAVAITGGFASGVAKPPAKDAGAAAPPQLLEHSPPGTRIVVFGSSSFASDMLLAGQQLASNLIRSNIQLVHNAVDWALADTDLLAIRARTPAARAITVPPDERDTWQYLNIALAFLGLAGVVGLAWFRRRSVKPFVTAKEV